MNRSRFIGAMAVSMLFVGCGRSGSDDNQSMSTEAVRAQLFATGESELEAIYGADTATDRELAADRQRFIQQCMADAGYDYQPVPSGPSTPSSREFDRLGEATFVEKYGYGRATLWEAEEGQSVAVSASFVDVNKSIRDGLPSNEQQAYDEALLGPVKPGLGEDGRPMPADPWEGCSGKAMALVASVELPPDAMSELEDLRHTIAADSELLAAEEDWSACMAEDGWSFRRREEAVESVIADLDALTRAPVGDRPIEALDMDGAAVTVRIPKLDPAGLEAVSRREIDIATADFQCAETTGYARVRAEVRQRHQETFVEQWQDRLIIHQSE